MNTRDFSVAIHEATNAEWPAAVRAGRPTSGRALSLGGFPLGGNTTSAPAPRPRQVRSWCSTLRFCRKIVPKPAPIAKTYRSYGRRAQILRLHAGRILWGLHRASLLVRGKVYGSPRSA